jgi:hypothetical protein
VVGLFDQVRLDPDARDNSVRKHASQGKRAKGRWGIRT